MYKFYKQYTWDPKIQSHMFTFIQRATQEFGLLAGETILLLGCKIRHFGEPEIQVSQM